MKKIELAIYLIEKGHNRIAAEKSKTTSKGTNVYHKKEGDVRNEGRNSEKRRSYYTSV
ncbi:MAG: hypothetical protein IKS09_00035 [Lachnospiraceae bacterium]|nr:hypothetical protein [Lachnospiraceae bacterium]